MFEVCSRYIMGSLWSAHKDILWRIRCGYTEVIKSFPRGSQNRRQNPEKRELKELQSGMDWQKKVRFKVMESWGVSKESKEERNHGIVRPSMQPVPAVHDSVVWDSTDPSNLFMFIRTSVLWAGSSLNVLLTPVHSKWWKWRNIASILFSIQFALSRRWHWENF